MARLCMLMVLIALTAPVGASQTARKYERGDDGKLTWTPHSATECKTCMGKKKPPCRGCSGGKKKKAARCLECLGKKKAPCRTCAGSGKTFDPFAYYPCRRCEGKGYCPCGICGGSLALHSTAKGSPPKCRSCAKKGGTKCAVCKGKRLMKFTTIKGLPLEQASAEELRALRKKLRKPLDGAQAYAKEGSKFPKRIYTRVMDAVIEVLPEFKNEKRACEKAQKLCTRKQKDLGSNLPKALANFRATSTYAAINAMQWHMNLIETLLDLHKRNARTK